MVTETRKEFLLAEHASLRNEILEMIKDSPRNQRLALIINGSFWAWITTNLHSPPYVYVSIWAPLLLTVLLYLRSDAMSKKTKALHNYLLQVEAQFELDGLGWETYIQKEGRAWVSNSVKVFWGALVFANVVFIISTVMFR